MKAVYTENGKEKRVNVTGIVVSLQGEDIRPEIDYKEWEKAVIERSGLIPDRKVEFE